MSTIIRITRELHLLPGDLLEVLESGDIKVYQERRAVGDPLTQLAVPARPPEFAPVTHVPLAPVTAADVKQAIEEAKAATKKIKPKIDYQRISTRIREGHLQFTAKKILEALAKLDRPIQRGELNNMVGQLAGMSGRIFELKMAGVISVVSDMEGRGWYEITPAGKGALKLSAMFPTPVPYGGRARPAKKKGS